MGRFAFDGAEGFAFHIYSDESQEELAISIQFKELPLLVEFLRHNFPGMFV
jgi:hypothetical protein